MASPPPLPHPVVAERRPTREEQPGESGWPADGRWWTRSSVLALSAANLVPIAGVALLGWDVRSILLIYWCESAVIGLYNALKMVWIGGARATPLIGFFAAHYGLFMFAHLIFLVGLTWQAAGGGWESHSLGHVLRDAFDTGQWAAVLGLLVSHGVSFFTNFLRGREYDQQHLLRRLDRLVARKGPAAMEAWREAIAGWGPAEQSRMLWYVGVMTQMFAPYARIVLMHLTLIAGGLALMFLGATQWPLLLLLIVGKTAVDVRAHGREHHLFRAA